MRDLLFDRLPPVVTNATVGDGNSGRWHRGQPGRQAGVMFMLRPK